MKTFFCLSFPSGYLDGFHTGSFYLIHASDFRVQSLGANLGHHLAEVARIATSEDGGESLLQGVEDVRSGHLETRLALLGQGEHFEEGFFFRRVSIEGAVVELYLRLFFLR